MAEKFKIVTAIAHYLFAIAFLYFGISIRTAPVEHLEGKYLFGNDPYHFLHLAQMIDENGELPKLDTMRWLPEGRDLTTSANATAYAIAHLTKFVRLFRSVSVYQVAVYFPILCYAFMLIILYFTAKEIFDPQIALLSLFIATIAPHSFFRSVGGFADRDAFVLLLAMIASFFYLKRTRSDSQKMKWIWNGGFGLAMIWLGLTWEGIGLFLSIFVLIWFVKLWLGVYSKSHLHLDASSFGAIAIALLIFTQTYRNGSAFVILAFAPALIFFLITITIPKVKTIDRLKIPIEITVSLIFFVVIGLLATIIKPISKRFSILANNFISILGESQLMATVGELADTTFFSWVIEYQWLIFFVIGGMLLLLYRVSRAIRFNPWVMIGPFSLVLIGVIYHHLFPNREIIINSLYLIAIVGSFLIFIGYRIYQYRKNIILDRDDFAPKTEMMIWSLGWGLILLFASRGAVRYHFFIVPMIAIYVAFGLVEFLRWTCGGKIPRITFFPILIFLLLWAFQTHHFFRSGKSILPYVVTAIGFLAISSISLLFKLRSPKLLRSSAIIVLVLIANFGLSKSITRSAEISAEIKPLHAETWSGLFEWIDQNLDQNVVIAAHWNYGNQINVLARRGTILNPDHYHPDRISEVFRHVFLAQTDAEALQFLKKIGATHLIFTRHDLLEIDQISQVAERSVIPIRTRGTFQENADQVWLYPTEKVNFPESIRQKFNDPKLDYIRVDLKKGETDQMRRVSVGLKLGEETIEMPIETIYFNGIEYRSNRSDALPGALVISKLGMTWHGNFLSQIGYNSLLIRLFMLDRYSPHFKMIFPTKSFQKENFTNVKIWEIVDRS